MKIQLQAEGRKTIDIEIDQDAIMNSAILVYEGEYYVFGGQTGRFFTGARFNLVEAPYIIPTVYAA